MKIFRRKIECDGIDIDFITTPKGEPDKRYDTQYAVFDCDGNGEAELHVQSARYYYIFQYKMVLCSYIKIYHLIRITML